jgi:predicted PurR-regulated permease PerM
MSALGTTPQPRASEVNETVAGLTEAAAWRVAARTVLLAFALVLAVWLVVRLQSVLVQLLLAVILAAGMGPLVNQLAAHPWVTVGRWSWRPSRGLVVLVLYLALVLLVSLLGAILVPPLVNEIEDLVRRLPGYAADLQAWLLTLPERYPFLPAIDLAAGLAEQLRAGAAQLASLLGQALLLVRLALGLLSGTLNGIFVLILALYLTADSERILRSVLSFLPADRQELAERVAFRIGERLGGWVRGQIALSVIIGTITFVGLTLIDVRYAVLLALIAAIGEAVPMVGPIFSAIPAVMIASLQSPLQGLLTLGLYILVQQLENNLIVPKVMERAVALHPLVVLLALLSGAELLGVAGAVLAVPVAAALAVVLDEVRRERHSSC